MGSVARIVVARDFSNGRHRDDNGRRGQCHTSAQMAALAVGVVIPGSEGVSPHGRPVAPLMPMLVMTEMLGVRSLRLVRAIRAARTPGHLEWHDKQQNGKQPATHGNQWQAATSSSAPTSTWLGSCAWLDGAGRDCNTLP